MGNPLHNWARRGAEEDHPGVPELLQLLRLALEGLQGEIAGDDEVVGLEATHHAAAVRFALQVMNTPAGQQTTHPTPRRKRVALSTPSDERKGPRCANACW